MQLIMKVSQQKKATKTAGAASRKTASSRTLLKLVKNDEWLAPYTEAIRGRHEQALRKIDLRFCLGTSLFRTASYAKELDL